MTYFRRPAQTSASDSLYINPIQIYLRLLQKISSMTNKSLILTRFVPQWSHDFNVTTNKLPTRRNPQMFFIIWQRSSLLCVQLMNNSVPKIKNIDGACVRLGKVSLPLVTGQKWTGAWDNMFLHIKWYLLRMLWIKWKWIERCWLQN